MVKTWVNGEVITAEKLNDIENNIVKLGNNRNLLYNGNFINPVNQRGEKQYTQKGYAISSWFLGDGVMELSEKGIVLKKGWIAHRFEDLYLCGKQLTVSLLTADNNLYYFTFVYEYTTSWDSVENEFAPGLLFTAQRDDAENQWRIVFNTTGRGGSEWVLKSVKLELGDTQTLARQEGGKWILNDAPDYGAELLKCQRYYQVFETQALRPAKALDFRPTMRVDPVLSTALIGGKTVYTASAEL